MNKPTTIRERLTPELPKAAWDKRLNWKIHPILPKVLASKREENTSAQLLHEALIHHLKMLSLQGIDHDWILSGEVIAAIWKSVRAQYRSDIENNTVVLSKLAQCRVIMAIR